MESPNNMTLADDKSNHEQPKPQLQQKKKKKLGRQARKRRKKALAIEEAAAFAAAASVTATSSLDVGEEKRKDGVVPTDRSYVLDAVRQKSDLSQLDCQRLVGQLGYLPGNAVSVAARVKDMFTRRSSNNNSNNKKNSSSMIPEPNDTVSTETAGISRRLEALKKKQTMSVDAAWDDLLEQPLVLKIYPLAIREESDSTRSRRKRKRQQQNNTGDTNTGSNDDQATSSTPATEGSSSNHSPTSDESNPSGDNNRLMEPFPTIYWVTHPYAKALISKLELERLGSVYEKCLQKPQVTQAKQHGGQGGNGNDEQHQSEAEVLSPNPLDLMKRAHLSYGQERYDMLTSEDLQWIQTKNKSWTEAFNPSTRGVAGIRNPAGVKCLHAHAGHYWSGCDDNIVGQWVADRVLDMWLSNLESQQSKQGAGGMT